MRSRTTRLCLIGVILLCAPRLISRSLPPDGVSLQVVSLRVLSDEEAGKRTPDALGANVVVRLRLSAVKQSIFIYAWGDFLQPPSYAVREVDGKTEWMRGGPKDYLGSSPGLKELTLGLPGKWFLLARGSALEWEVDDSTNFRGEKHARTVFIKLDEKAPPLEIFSSWYQVPRAGGPAFE